MKIIIIFNLLFCSSITVLLTPNALVLQLIPCRFFLKIFYCFEKFFWFVLWFLIDHLEKPHLVLLLFYGFKLTLLERVGNFVNWFQRIFKVWISSWWFIWSGLLLRLCIFHIGEIQIIVVILCKGNQRFCTSIWKIYCHNLSDLSI